ncbi:MAG: GDP-L-fucose synthase [Ignavibacteria bacterium]|nr:GDP-L-fucose synthase [Ignavibacteria bacterium]
MDKSSKIYLAGHLGMVGSAIHRELKKVGYTNVIGRGIDELDLMRQADVEAFIAQEKPSAMIIAAAKVGGILANNTYRAQFLYENLMIQNNLIHAAYLNGVEKLIFLGSSCIYPKLAPQPLKEEYLLSDYLEYTNEPYAIAKIAGIKMCESYYKQYGCNYFSVMPTNLYGPYDNFNLETSHVMPALIRKFHEAKVNGAAEVVMWGTGSPFREFLYVEDLANAVVYLMDKINAKDVYDLGISQINIGTGEDITIGDLAKLIKNIVGFEGRIVHDTSKPDGTPKKLLDVSRLRSLGWTYQTSLEEGVRKAYEWFLNNVDKRQ